ncbi:MAG: metal ABC transporter solute-binding protein, Zn/Mn family [Sulfurovaceae bacterium]
MKPSMLFKLFLPLMMSSLLFAKTTVAVSVLPQENITKAIGGDKIDILLMVKPGTSPHSYEPKPAQMIALSNAKLYLSIGVEFEHAWLAKFKAQNPRMKIVDSSRGIKRIEIAAHHHDEDKHHEDTNHKEEGKDPHVWTSPMNIKIIAANTLQALIQTDPSNKAYYEANYRKLLQKIVATDKQIRSILKNTPKGSKFMVFHPAWGYFASSYGLVQVPIEVEGKEPKPSALGKLIKQAKAQNIRAIFTQPEFSDKSAHLIASQLHISVIKASPLAADWSANLIGLARAIAVNTSR